MCMACGRKRVLRQCSDQRCILHCRRPNGSGFCPRQPNKASIGGVHCASQLQSVLQSVLQGVLCAGSSMACPVICARLMPWPRV